VLAILGGLGAALAWAATTLCASRSSRMIGPLSVLSWVMIVGLLVTLPGALAQGVPANLASGTVAWLTLSGIGNVAGLLLTYAALRSGKIGIVAPLASTEGAVAAVISVAAGEHVAPGAGVVLLVIAVGIVLTTISRATPHVERDSARPALLALAAAAAFGSSLYATGHVGTRLPVFWAVLPPRVVGVAVVALPLAARGRLVLTRSALPLVVIGGLAEVAGFISFTLGSRHGLAVSAVLASQFAAISTLLAFLVFRERLLRVQVAGVATIVAGVAVLTVLQS
jgi:drug/metabolite transporter (DMT)-like permease